MKVVLSPEAKSELDEIWFYIYQDSRREDVADRVADEIQSTIAILGKSPMAGRSRAREFGAGIRSMPSDDYVIFYKVTSGRVFVLHVFHGRRDITGLLTSKTNK